MPENDATRIEIANTVKGTFAQDQSLTPIQARAFVRSLQTTWQVDVIQWNGTETTELLSQAGRLLHAAQILSTVDGGSRSDANLAYRRAGELYEWLARSNDDAAKEIPIALFAAGAYQLGGLSAMASGILNQVKFRDAGARLFADFLKGNFDGSIAKAMEFWKENPDLTTRNASQAYFTDEAANDLAWFAVVELVRSVGLSAYALRRGNEIRLRQAISRLRTIESWLMRAASEDVALLAFFVRATCEYYAAATIFKPLERLSDLRPERRPYLQIYARRQYARGRGILWQSQQEGIERLLTTSSFALCTPTGSGKTMVANLAIVKELLLLADDAMAPLALYLVPSRALAGEVEAKLTSELGREFIVTGLYGGADWGITDAWLTADSPVVLIATVEKADALMRYLGPLLLSRLKLLILDEAHQVVTDDSDYERKKLAAHSNRSIRLESLVARILSQKPDIVRIALTAVAGGAADPVARWIEADDDAKAVGSHYRSSRQAIGRLQISGNGSAQIGLDMLNDRPLAIVGRADGLYINLRIPRMPQAPSAVRYGLNRHTQTAVLWTALHLIDSDRRILVSLTQSPEDTIRWFAEAFDLAGWDAIQKFQPPTNGKDADLFAEARRVCVDYCGSDSYEVKLLDYGIATNHGQMPQRLRRMMVALVENSICRITVATATLTEGVNLPFDIIILPSLKRTRYDKAKKSQEEFPMPTSEFRNLSGRAGRPGAAKGMEGITLAVLPIGRSTDAKSFRATQDKQILACRADYIGLIERLKNEAAGVGQPSSPLSVLIKSLRTKALGLPNINTDQDFLAWLDAATPVAISPQAGTGETSEHAVLADTLDELDGIILSAIEEVQNIEVGEMTVARLEALLAEFWQKTFTRVAAAYEAWMSAAFIRRGLGLIENVYTDRNERKRLYSYGYTPHVGRRFEAVSQRLIDILQQAEGYGALSDDERIALFDSLGDVVAADGGYGFEVKDTVTSQRLFDNWRNVLRWWMNVAGSAAPPVNNLRDWQTFVSENFEFRLGVAVGASVAKIWTEKRADPFETPTLQTWKNVSELPWFAFWAKELLRWGTLDPFVAFVLSQGIAKSRPEAADLRPAFMDWLTQNPSEQAQGEAIIDPQNYLKWSKTLQSDAPAAPTAREAEGRFFGARGRPEGYPVVLSRTDKFVSWMDAAGYELARSDDQNTFDRYSHENDFDLTSVNDIATIRRVF